MSFISLGINGLLASDNSSNTHRIKELWRWNELEELRGKDISCAVVDNQQKLWLGGTAGLYSYDGIQVLEYPFPKELSYGSPVRQIVNAKNDIKYVYTSPYLCSFSPKRGWKIITNTGRLGLNNIHFLCLENGKVLMSSSHGLHWIFQDKITKWNDWIDAAGEMCLDSFGQLWIVNATKNQLQTYTIENDPFHLNLIHSIPISNKNLRVFPANQKGVAALNRNQSNEITIYSHSWETHKISISDEIDPNRNFNMTYTPNDEILIIQTPILAFYSKNNWSVLNIEEFPLPPTGSFIQTLPKNKIFLGGKLARNFVIDLSDLKWKTYENLNFQTDDGDGNEWFIHKNRNIYIHHAQVDDWRILDDNENIIDSPNRIFLSKDKTVWISGAHKGNAAISYRDNDGWHLDQYPRIGTNISHLAVIETQDGTLAFGNGSTNQNRNTSPGGIVIYRKTNGQYKGIELLAPLYTTRPATLAERVNDGIWTGGFALFRNSLQNPLGMERDDQIQTGWVDHIATDKDNNLWVAIWGEGVHRYDGSNWQTFGISEGLISNESLFVLPGKKLKGIWVATRDGISRYDGKSWSKNVFTQPFALPRESGTLAESTNGDLWINSSHREWLLNIHHAPQRPDAPHRTIRYRQDRHAPDTKLIKFENQIHEPANAFFQWKGADFWNDTPTEMLEFSHRLSGEKWGPFAKTTEVSLLDLPAGQYTFEVRARDRDWNIDPTPATVRFKVIPPLWKRPWFISIIVAISLVIIALIAIMVQMRLSHILALKEFKLDFFTNLSHELRTPLTVILGPLEGLSEKAQTEQDKRTFEMVIRNARKMLGLVNQLLEFRKVELGKLKFQPAEGELIGFIKDSVYSLAPLWEKKKQKVNINSNLGAYRCGFDPDKLQRIIDNVLSNAIKYTPENGGIKLHNQIVNEQEKSFLKLIVTDNGIGIPSSKLSHIMDPFYQVQANTKEKTGSGIGLALVKELVDLWEGSIDIKSSQKKGSSGTHVELTLPLVSLQKIQSATKDIKPNESIQQFDLSPPSNYQESEDHVRPKVLIVEDNEDLRMYLQDELSRKFDMITAENGLTGLDAALQNNPDLIVSDVMMPEMDGMEFCSKIRENAETSHIPIIILTARSADEHYLEGIDKGVDEFFGKPVKTEILIARIENLLKSRQSLRDLFSNPNKIDVNPSEVTTISGDQKLLASAIGVVERNFETEGFDVEMFSQIMAMSRATLFRKLKAITGLSPGDFIRMMRLKRAAQFLQSTDYTISEIIGKTGYYDASNFSRSFRKEFGMTPTEYRSQTKSDKTPERG